MKSVAMKGDLPHHASAFSLWPKVIDLMLDAIATLKKRKI
jgi:hypothetical protein